MTDEHELAHLQQVEYYPKSANALPELVEQREAVYSYREILADLEVIVGLTAEIFDPSASEQLLYALAFLFNEDNSNTSLKDLAISALLYSYFYPSRKAGERVDFLGLNQAARNMRTRLYEELQSLDRTVKTAAKEELGDDWLAVLLHRQRAERQDEARAWTMVYRQLMNDKYSGFGETLAEAEKASLKRIELEFLARPAIILISGLHY